MFDAYCVRAVGMLSKRVEAHGGKGFNERREATRAERIRRAVGL